MAYVLLAAGLAVLLFGAELLVRGSVAIARRLEIPPAVIGLTVVALGTSAPEFVISAAAVLQGASGVAVGTVVGSNIANVLVVLALPAVVYATSGPTSLPIRDLGAMVVAGPVLFLFAADGVLARWQGAVLVALLLTALFASWRSVRSQRQRAPRATRTGGPPCQRRWHWSSPARPLCGSARGLWCQPRSLLPPASASPARSSG